MKTVTTMTADRAAIAAKFPREIADLFAIDAETALTLFCPDIELRQLDTGGSLRYIAQLHPSPIAELFPERDVVVELVMTKQYRTAEGLHVRREHKMLTFSSYGETKMAFDLPQPVLEWVLVEADPGHHIRETNENNNTLRYPENWP